MPKPYLDSVLGDRMQDIDEAKIRTEVDACLIAKPFSGKTFGVIWPISSPSGTARRHETAEELPIDSGRDTCMFPGVVVLPLVMEAQTFGRTNLAGAVAPQGRRFQYLGDGGFLRTLEPFEEPDVPHERPVVQGGLVVPPQKRRFLVCAGGASNVAGAVVIWNHLRNQREGRKPLVTGNGMMAARSSSLGSCNMAPVLQVLSEGIYYGGIAEEAVDRVITEHLIGVLSSTSSARNDFERHQEQKKPV